MGKDRKEAMRVEGLAELQRALREIDKDLPKELRRANKEVAESIASDARGKARGVKGGDRLARGIKAVAQQRSAGIDVRDGGTSAGALGYEFGAYRSDRRTRSTGEYTGYRQFDEWRGNGGSAGYAVYPTVREHREHLAEDYARAIDPLLARAFPDGGAP